MAVGRWDIDSAVDRIGFVNGRGHLIGLPNNSATSNATTGVPVNATQGWCPGALFINFKGSIGSYLYVNTGTFASSTWTNVV